MFGAPAPNVNSLPVQPIVSLNPFGGQKWWIKARVVDKSDKRQWNKVDSRGQLFSCTLVDESAAIRATFFQEAVDKFFPVLQSGTVYFFSGGTIKAANKKFNNVNNEYECTFDKDAQIIRAQDAASNIPQQRYNFVPIAALKQREVGSMVDVLGVVLDAGTAGNFTSKAGQSFTKRGVKIADKTASVEVTVWGDQAIGFNKPVGATVAIKAAKVSTYQNAVTLGTTSSSSFEDPSALREAAQLREWYQATGGADVPNISAPSANGPREFRETKRKYFDDIQRENLGKGDEPDYFEVRCVPTYIRSETIWYEACPTCNKKVSADVKGAAGQARCEKCDRMVPAPVPRYMCSIQASDNVGQCWLTLFNEAGEQFFGMTAAELKQKSKQDDSFLPTIAQQCLYKPVIMRCRVKEDRMTQAAADPSRGGDGSRVTVSVVSVNQVKDYGHEAKLLLDAIALYN